MIVTGSYGLFRSITQNWAYTQVIYTLNTGKIAKVILDSVTVFVIDNGGPAEAAFLNQYPGAYKATDITD